MASTPEFDFVVIGSGFGGSVSAHRLTEKGYSVAVIEQGRRFRTGEFAKTSWNLRKSIWAPKAGLTGIMAITVFKDVVIFHGAGVGGGSLVYANTHLEPLDAFYVDPKWRDLADWKNELAPHYREAKRMLGSVPAPHLFESDNVLKEVLDEMGTGDTFKPHTVGVYFGENGKEAPDPYFDGEGPTRVGCTYCGRCMLGCNHGAKNTLDKNYLHLAEKCGAKIVANTRVVDVRPRGAADGTDGYIVTTAPTLGLRRRRQQIGAKNVVFSGGVLGTLELLYRCRDSGSLPRLSQTLGTYVRTNSESIQGIQAYERDVSRGIAITSGGFTPDGTHIEMFRYGQDADALAFLSTVHVPGGKLPRQLYFLGAMLRHPWITVRALWPFGWSKALAGVLAMQAVDNSMQLRWKRPWYWPFRKSLSSDWGDRERPPTFLPAANEVAERVAKKLGGVAGSVLPEVLFDTTTTAHILGGCPIGKTDADGVIDAQHRVFHYAGLYVADGSAVCANLGVNPTLTITAMTERAMSFIPPRGA